MIHLVNGLFAKKAIKGTFALAHEHLNFDLTPIRRDSTSLIQSIQEITHALTPALKQGLGLIVDLSNQSMLPNKEALITISNKLAIPIVTATGYYLNEYEQGNKKTIEDIEKEFINDLTHGFANTNVRAGIIGEIATSSEQIYPFERKVFTAAVNVQKSLGVAIYTHCNLGNQVKNQAKLLLELGANPAKTILGHLDFATESDLFYVLQKGFNVGIDTIGKQNYLADHKRILRIMKIINRGYLDQLVLSLDISSKRYLKAYGGHGYDYLQGAFKEMCQQKITSHQWTKITWNNILRILDF